MSGIPSIIAPTHTQAAEPALADRPTNVKQAAQAFEALLMGQILKMVRESGQGGALGEADGASSSVFEMAEENLAKIISSNGGLGLAQLIERQLSAHHTQNVNEKPAVAGSSHAPAAAEATIR